MSQLSGKLPDSLKYCRSLQTLDLSNNALSGSIPAQICTWLPYIVTLDLSSNQFSGSIPAELVNCKFLNNLILSGNKLSGSIPYGLGTLERLKKFSVADNDLSGSVPADLVEFPQEDFDGNGDLCGKPLGKCGGLSGKSLGIIIVAGVIGAAGSLILGFVIWWWLFVRGSKKKKDDGGGGSKGDSSWVDLLRSHKLVQVSLFQKPIVKIKLSDLLLATNNFDLENIVISTQTGVSYKADLPDGFTLAIKRFSACKLNEKQFRSEMNHLGQLRHPNLVPLLGFCVVEEEKLLVYKHMPNGYLHSRLHGFGFGVSPDDVLDWPTRVRIGVGASRGLTGQKPLEVDTRDEGFKGNLVDWVHHLVTISRSKDAIDKALGGKGYEDEVMQFLKVAWSCVASRPKDSPSMYQVYESLKGMAEKHGFSDQYDEFPMIFGKQDPEYKE